MGYGGNWPLAPIDRHWGNVRNRGGAVVHRRKVKDRTRPVSTVGPDLKPTFRCKELPSKRRWQEKPQELATAAVPLALISWART
jgi:hypothetical protein